MWAILALTAALLTSFNPILYKRLLLNSGPVVVVWGVIGLALPLLADVARGVYECTRYNIPSAEKRRKR